MKDFKSGERKNSASLAKARDMGIRPNTSIINKKKKIEKSYLARNLGKYHDTVWWQGVLISHGIPTIAEVSKLLFCKLKDEKATIKNKAY